MGEVSLEKCKPGSYLKCLPKVRADKCKNKLPNKIWQADTDTQGAIPQMSKCLNRF